MSKKEIKKSKSNISNNKFINNIYKFPVSYIILLILIVIIYFESFNFPLEKLDEVNTITSNIEYLKDPGNFFDALTRDAFFKTKGLDFYRPIQNMSFMIDSIIGSGNQIFYHISNILLHFITCCLLFNLLKKLGISNILSFCMSIIFAVHPLFVHAVSWILGRGDILLCLFSLASFIFLLNQEKNPKFSIILIHYIFLILALFSKETGLVLPLIFLFYLIIIRKNKFNQYIYNIVLYVIFDVFYFIIRSFVINQNPAEIINLSVFIKNLATIPEFLLKSIIPIGLSPMPAYSTIFIILGVLLLIICSIIILKSENKEQRKLLIFGIFWFVILLLPSAAFSTPISDNSYNYLEHRNYLPIIGIFIFISLFLNSLKKLSENNLISISVIIIIIFGIISFKHNKIYNNAETFYNEAIATNPTSGLAYNNLGYAYQTAGMFRDALELFNKAVQYIPDYSYTWDNRGTVKYKMKQYSSALEDFNKAISLNKNFSLAYNNRGLVKTETGDFNSAIEDYNLCLEINPKSHLAYNNRGIAYANLGDINSAMSDFQDCIKLNPRFEAAYNNLGTAQLNSGKVEEALENYTKAININPKYGEAFNNRGKAYLYLLNNSSACEEFKQAAALGYQPANENIQKYCK